MAPLPASPPDTDRRWVLRVPPDPYLRFDTYDYSLDPRLVGRRVEARVDQTARSWRSRWTPASSPAGTRARSPGTGRSPRSSTPAALKTQRAERRGAASRSSRSGSLAAL